MPAPSPQALTSAPAAAPRPLSLDRVEQALVVSFGAGRPRGISRPAAVFDAKGKALMRAQCRRDSRLKVTTTPPLPGPEEAVEDLPGTWLFGGMLYAHFGHFLCESTARLWPLARPDVQVDGVLFYPKKNPTWPKKFLAPILPWLTIAGVRVPVRLAIAPVRVERLLVPEQAFGTGDMVGGTPEFHAYATANFGRDIAPAGAEKIYISRSNLYSKRGRILGEAALEGWLAAEGYRIYHPQEHPIADQIAQYKAAHTIISTDGSALHLAAFCAKPGDRIAIIARRPGDTVGDFTAQYRSFAGLEPVVLSAITGLYSYEGAKLGQMSEIYSAVDYPALQAGLAEAGFVAGGPVWANPTAAEATAELADWSAKMGVAIRPLDEMADAPDDTAPPEPAFPKPAFPKDDA